MIATGSRPRPLNIPGCERENIFRLKTLEEAIRLRTFIDTRNPRKAVSIGAGFIALEMAEAFRGRGIENTILHRGSLPRGRLDPEISKKILETLTAHGVEFVPEAALREFSGDGSGPVREVHTDRGVFPADLVLASIGVVPDTDLARQAGIEIGPSGGIAVNERQETNLPGVYAAGDCCEVLHRVSGERVSIQLGDLANKQGWVAGENAGGGNASYPGVIGSAQFKCFELEIGQTGLGEQEAQRLGFRPVGRVIEDASRARVYPGSQPILIKLIIDRDSHRLLGAQITGTDGAALRINTLAVAVDRGMTVEELARLDFAYAPPFSPAIDPILVAARVAEKDLSGK